MLFYVGSKQLSTELVEEACHHHSHRRGHDFLRPERSSHCPAPFLGNFDEEDIRPRPRDDVYGIHNITTVALLYEQRNRDISVNCGHA